MGGGGDVIRLSEMAHGNADLRMKLEQLGISPCVNTPRFL